MAELVVMRCRCVSIDLKNCAICWCHCATTSHLPLAEASVHSTSLNSSHAMICGE
ncbi:MAG: hypothetical protein WHX60_06250 [Armatimonadota bacterium]